MFFLDLLSYNFIQNAIIIGFFSSIICGIIGPFILYRNLIFITTGISHASFGGIGLAFYLNFPLIYGSILFSIFGSLCLSIFEYKKIQDKNIMLSIFSVFGMSFGSLFVYLSSRYTSDINGYIFGNIFFLSSNDIKYAFYIFLIIVTFFYIFYRELIALSFDLEFLSLTNFPVLTINTLFYFLIALGIVILIHIVGILLIVSLMTIPASIASILTRSFHRMIIISTFFSMFFVYLGIILSYILNVPSGPMITIPATFIWGIINIIDRIFSYMGKK